MQIDNNNRVGIVTASTIAGVGAGVAAGHYFPMVNHKNQAVSDKFVKEVGKEITNNKLVNLAGAASARDYLDTIYAGSRPSAKAEQVDKFFNRYGDFLEIKRELLVDKDAKPLTGGALREKLYSVVADKIAANGEVKFSEDGKLFNLVAKTEDTEAQALIKNGFDKKKNLVKAGTTISEEGHSALQAAIKTIKNERMLKGGVIGGALALAVASVLTCQRD